MHFGSNAAKGEREVRIVSVCVHVCAPQVVCPHCLMGTHLQCTLHQLMPFLWLDHVCGCCWGDVRMKTDQAHTIPFSGGHAQFFQMSWWNLFVWVCVYTCLCDCLCVSVVFLFVCSVCVHMCTESLIHACAWM